MAERGKDIPNAQLESSVKKALSSKEPFTRWIDVINALADEGLKIDPKYTLFIMKFHMTLGSEGYVSPGEFQKKVASRINELLSHQKLPVTLFDEYRCVGGKFRSLLGLRDLPSDSTGE
jgi:hypothetical protein